jgi:hypothetical protein
MDKKFEDTLKEGQEDLDAMLKRREAATQRKRNQRERQKTEKLKQKAETKSAELEEQSYRSHLENLDGSNRCNAEGLAHRAAKGQVFMGELFPGVDCRTAQDELVMAMEFSRAMKTSQPRVGQTIADYVSQVFDQWRTYDKFNHDGNPQHAGPDATCNGCGPFLHRKSGVLSYGWGWEYWQDTKYNLPSGCEVVLTEDNIPELDELTP